MSQRNFNNTAGCLKNKGDMEVILLSNSANSQLLPGQ